MINPLPSKPAWPPTEGDIQFLPATSHRSSRVSTDSAASTDSAGQKVFHFAEDHPFQRSGLSRFFSSNKIRPEETETDRAPAKKQGLFRRISSVALSIFSKRPESTDSVTPFYLNSVDESPELFRRPAKTNPVTQILQSNEYTTFTKRSDAIWKTILEEEPALSKKIEQFQKEHSQKIGMLTTWPWKSLVNTWGINLTEKCDEDHLSYEEFRDKANQFIDSMCAEAAKQMKLPAVNWFDIGSKGYTSDVDLSMRGVDKEVTPYEAFIYKLLRDTTHNFIFSGLSGVQLDTESYPPVLSKTIDSATMLQTSEYTTTEIAMKLLHRKNDLPSEDWQIFCQNELGAIKDQSTKNTVQEMMSCIGDWHEVMKTDILREVVGDLADTLKPKELEETALSILKEDPLAYDRAAINYRTPIIMNLAESNNALMKEIKKLETQQGKMSTADQEKHHQMVVKYDFIYKMLVSLLPESTYSGSEWTATLGEQQYIVDASIATKTLKRKLSKGEAGAVHPPTLNEPTATELSIAASVECQQFMNKTHDIHTGVNQNPEKDLINGSKYLLRLTKNISKAIESHKKQNPHFEINIDKYLEIATQLEQCK
ncbi:MAG: hypothetical protein WCG42_05285, partial [Parachlamydiaceae bacterium]